MFDNIEIFIKLFCNILLIFFDKKIYYGGFNFFSFMNDMGQLQQNRELKANKNQADAINIIGTKIKKIGNSFDEQFAKNTVFGIKKNYITTQSKKIFNYIKTIIRNYGNNDTTLYGLKNSLTFIEELITNLNKNININKKKGGEILSTAILIAILYLIHNILKEELEKFTDEIIKEGKRVFENFNNNTINKSSTSSKNITNKNTKGNNDLNSRQDSSSNTSSYKSAISSNYLNSPQDTSSISGNNTNTNEITGGTNESTRIKFKNI